MIATQTKLGRKARILGGTSSALAGCLWASPAHAQAMPGSPECPVVNDVVTCSGSLPNGVDVSPGSYEGLTLRNVTGDMAATNRALIRYVAGRPNTHIILDDPDLALRLTSSQWPAARRDRHVRARQQPYRDVEAVNLRF